MNNVIFLTEYQSGKQSGRKHNSRYFPICSSARKQLGKSTLFSCLQSGRKKHYINIHIFLSALKYTVTGTPKARRKVSPRASGTEPVTKDFFLKHDTTSLQQGGAHA